jgi:hypothetical protein
MCFVRAFWQICVQIVGITHFQIIQMTKQELIEQLEAHTEAAFQLAHQLHSKYNDIAGANVKGKLKNALALTNPKKALAYSGQVVSQSATAGTGTNERTGVAAFSTQPPPARKGAGSRLSALKKKVTAPAAKKRTMPTAPPVEAVVEEPETVGLNPAELPQSSVVANAEEVSATEIEGTIIPSDNIEIPATVVAATQDGRLSVEEGDLLEKLASMSTHEIAKTYKDSLDQLLETLEVDEKEYAESNKMQKAAIIKKTITDLSS